MSANTTMTAGTGLIATNGGAQLNNAGDLIVRNVAALTVFDVDGATGNTTVGGTLNVTGLTTLATVDINGGNIDGTAIGASVASTGAFTTLNATGLSTLATVDINGGNIDGTAIGASVASSGVFTTLNATGLSTLATVDINGGNIDGTAIGVSATSTGAFTSVTASSGITASAGNIQATTGNITASAGSVSANTTVTAGTGLIATAGGVAFTGKFQSNAVPAAANGDIDVADGSVFIFDDLNTNSLDEDFFTAGTADGQIIWVYVVDNQDDFNDAGDDLVAGDVVAFVWINSAWRTVSF